MKRFMLVVVLFVCTTFAYSQKSICGVDFGSSYESAKSILENKFGKAEIKRITRYVILTENTQDINSMLYGSVSNQMDITHISMDVFLPTGLQISPWQKNSKIYFWLN